MKFGKIEGTAVVRGVDVSVSIEDGKLTIVGLSAALAMQLIEDLERRITTFDNPTAITNSDVSLTTNSDAKVTIVDPIAEPSPAPKRTREKKEKPETAPKEDRQLAIPIDATEVTTAPDGLTTVAVKETTAKPPTESAGPALPNDPPPNDKPGDGNPEWGLSKVPDELVAAKTFRSVILWLLDNGFADDDKEAEETKLVQEIDRLRQIGAVPVLTRMSPDAQTRDRVQACILTMGR